MCRKIACEASGKRNSMIKPKLIAVDGKTIPDDTTTDDYHRNLETDVLARTLWGEARGEGTQGMHAVANVILNRVKIAEKKGKYWWGNNIIQVCQKPYQFSCWNRSDPNFKKLQNVDEKDLYFSTAMRIARRAVMGCLDDVTKGSTHYHAADITPYWVKGEEAVTTIGNHVFYKLVD